VNDKHQRTCKEETVVCFKVISQHVHGRREEIETLVMMADGWTRILSDETS
jgi:hypothetical protein